MSTDTVDAFTDVKDIPIYYENGKGYLVSNGSKYVSMTEAAARRYLRAQGFMSEKAPRADVSMVEQALMKIQMEKNIDYAGALAGKNPGIYENAGSRVLVTCGPRIIEPDASVSWCLVRRIIEEMFGNAGEEQLTFLYGWLSTSYKTLRNGTGTLGQALVLAGPRDSGKTLLQAIITDCLGGRSANPYAYMSGATDFNRDLFGSECLMFGDEISSTDPRARRNFGSRLKQLTVNADQRCHAKGKDAITLRPFWRLVFSVNDEPENLMVLPPLDESMMDKIMILRVTRPALFSSDQWSTDRTTTWGKIEAELPGFIAHLDSFAIPASKSSKRFGICAYHDPEIKVSLQKLSPEMALLELVDVELFGGEGVNTTKWQGSAAQLTARLRRFDSNVRGQADNLLSWHSAAGAFLTRLSDQFPDRIQRRQKNKVNEYTILPPSAEGASRGVVEYAVGRGLHPPVSTSGDKTTDVGGSTKEVGEAPSKEVEPQNLQGLRDALC